MKKTTHVGKFGVITLLAAIGLGAQVFAYTTINSQLDLGETNADVTSMQVFFADNSAIYPEGLVTGYFGNLSRSAVQRFQVQNGIVSSGSAASTGYGRVGPSTRDKINSLITQGGWVVSDNASPWIYSVSNSVTNNSATFTWSTNEIAAGKIFYNTSPITMNEGDINSVGFGSTNGYTANNDGLARTSQQVMMANLQPNTLYYYVIVSTDLKGNVSVVGPNNTFRTNP
jgi:peptidoglycan hydrolase-like protein with peptidoglycan-binding domain